MGLSDSLISQFVKATKDDKKQSKKETTVYGTIVDDGGTKKVQLDGSDQLTPVEKAATAESGDRVTVLIKNHKATVTGNLSSPSVGTGYVDRFETLLADKVSTEELYAQAARIDTLVTDNATIRGLLAASEIKVSDIEADNIEINEKLTANTAEINSLKTSKLDAGVAEITYAKIGDLDAATADIRTLMFGSAGGNTIQTSFSNTVIGQLGDAQIKSAMIESISASKITAGNVFTNNVRIMSEDGNFLISDETLQIYDDTRVRVQVGKDATGDYSINVWDQNGNLMFSKGGITDAAIKEAIIRNDMVSEEANIDASKLNIDSLFAEINDSSNTIKSSKVYLDSEKQTLDIAFKSLLSEVLDNGAIVASQGTSIEVLQGYIATKIWQQDIDTATNELFTRYSTLEQTVDNISTTVASHTSQITNKADSRDIIELDSKVSSLELSIDGFRTTVSETYATKTSLTDTYNRTIHKSGTIDLTSDEYDVDTYYPVVGSIMPYDGYRYVGVNVQLNSGSKPSWSTHDGGFTCNASVRMKAGGWGTVDANTLGWIDDFTYNFCDKMPAYINQNRNASKPVLYLRGGGRYFVFTDYDSSWTVYTEDYTQSDYTFSPTASPSNSSSLVDNWKTVSRVSTAESNITQLSNKITANITETTDLGVRMSTIEQTADSLSIKISSIEIGGENLLVGSKEITNVLYGASSASDFNEDFKAAKCVGTWSGIVYLANDAISKSSAGDEFTFSVNMKTTSTACLQFFAMCYDGSNNRVYPTLSTGQFNSKVIVNSPDYEDDKRYSITLSIAQGWIDLIQSGGNIKWTLQIASGASTDQPVYLYAPKLEHGNKATDWSPNYADLYDGINNAAKTATNYLNFSSSGLVIGDLTASTLGKNILIDSDSVDIRSGTSVRASFGEDYLYLAKHSRNAKINLCNGLVEMYHQSKYSYDTLFIIDTPNATEIMGTYNPLCVTSTVSGKVAIQFANTSGVLGSIGMVESASGAMITRNVPSTASTYTVLDTGNFYTMMDSGWVNCTLNTGTFSRYSNDIPQPQVRKIGKQVYLRGEAKPSKEVTPANDQDTVIATIPSGYRPKERKQFIMQGSSSYRWLMGIHPDGTITISRYTNDTTTNKAVSSGAWLCCHADWLIE